MRIRRGNIVLPSSKALIYDDSYFLPFFPIAEYFFFIQPLSEHKSRPMIEHSDINVLFKSETIKHTLFMARGLINVGKVSEYTSTTTKRIVYPPVSRL